MPNTVVKTWSIILCFALQHILTQQTTTGLYESTVYLLNIFQTLAILEVVHAVIGFVRSDPVLTGFQVASRVFLTWAIAFSVPEVQNLIGVPLFIVSWAITEVIRYLFYALGLLGEVPYLIVWCRYTFFLVLYPAGVTGELLVLYSAMPYVQKSGIYSIRMPNKWNFGFDFYSFLFLVLALYIPIFPQLYGHMLKQRKKIVGGSVSEKKRN